MATTEEKEKEQNPSLQSPLSPEPLSIQTPSSVSTPRPDLSQLSLQSSSSSSVPGSQLPFSTPEGQCTMTPRTREDGAKEFVIDIGLEWSDLNKEQQTRAMKIQSPDFTWSPTRKEAPPNHRYTTTFAHEWSKFLEKLPEPHRAAFSTFENVFFNKEAVGSFMAIRRQLSGVCSAHSSVLTQHYIHSCRQEAKDRGHKMLDTSAFIRDSLPPDIQKRYVLEGVTGMGSQELLQIFTDTELFHYFVIHPCTKESDRELHRVDIKAIYDHFVKCKEPGLVSYFKAGAEFYEKSVLEGTLNEMEYKKIVDAKGKANIHSMVLIGAYKDKYPADDNVGDDDKDEDGVGGTSLGFDMKQIMGMWSHAFAWSPKKEDDNDRYWFLLQNTHEDQYFKLVTGEYLASCKASISFAHAETDMSLKDTFNVVDGEYSEAVVLEESMPRIEAEG